MSSNLPAPDQQEGRTANSQAAAAGRRDLKAALTTGELTLQGLFDAADGEGDGPRIAGHMHMRAALLALPRIGRTKANRILSDLGLPPSRHIAAIGTQQRQALIQAVSDAA